MLEEELFNPRVYTRAMDLVRTFVIGKDGSLEDAQDIFHEGLLVFMKKASQNQLKLTCAPEVYILGICKNLWRRRKPDHLNQIRPESMDNLSDSYEDSLKAKHKKEQFIKLIEKHVKNLTEKCRELFEYRAEGLSCEEVARKMNMDSAQISRNKMYTCKRRLWELIEQDPEYWQIIDDE